MKFVFTLIEIKEIVISTIVLSVAFALAFSDGIFNLNILKLPMLVIFSFIAVGIGFLAHELIGHKLVSQHYEIHAEYRLWKTGLAIAIAFSMFGVVFAAPGAVMIYQGTDLWGNTLPLSKKRYGIISIAGPVTNIIIATVFLAANSFYASALFTFAAQVNIWLAIFNMLPVPPLDGSKVFAWDKRIWLGFFAVCIAMFAALIYL
ncbi:MAG: site-2 protease family protein [Candidatus Aenigmarchaeota archaeon]|nr:site-2 protease family protein [Candidatus Aenigmarchaeota archaeon]